MPSYLMNGLGESASDPSSAQMEGFLRDLDPGDDEHGAAWLSDDWGRSLEYSVDGNLAYRREGHRCRHLRDVPHTKVVELWMHLAAQNLGAIEQEPWQPLSRAPFRAEESARPHEDDERRLKNARQFYDSLGAERADRPCQAPGCARGAVEHTVFCKPHHYEIMYRHKCPFDG